VFVILFERLFDPALNVKNLVPIQFAAKPEPLIRIFTAKHSIMDHVSVLLKRAVTLTGAIESFDPLRTFAGTFADPVRLLGSPPFKFNR